MPSHLVGKNAKEVERVCVIRIRCKYFAVNRLGHLELTGLMIVKGPIKFSLRVEISGGLRACPQPTEVLRPSHHSFHMPL